MSRAQKLLDRLLSDPPVADFTWSEALALMKHHNFAVINGRGSRRAFRHTSGIKVSCHEPHPEKILKKYAIRDLIDGLRNSGEIT